MGTTKRYCEICERDYEDIHQHRRTGKHIINEEPTKQTIEIELDEGKIVTHPKNVTNRDIFRMICTLMKDQITEYRTFCRQHNGLNTERQKEDFLEALQDM